MTRTYPALAIVALAIIALALGSPACAPRPAQAVTQAVTQTEPQRTLVWSDEFDDVGLPDPAHWGYDLGGGGWGNNELQNYTHDLANARVEDGRLIIEALRSGDGGFTSARLTTKEHHAWNRGRLEVRARLPTGRGTWPAIWMLGADIGEVGWPMSGEIDVMENVGYDPDTLVASIHTESYNHVQGTQRSRRIYKPGLYDDFHVYHLDWRADRLTIGVDGEDYFAFAKPADATRATWPFDVEHYLILNVAVGGNWGGQQGVDTTIWPQRLEVDWVRVYQ